MHSCRVGIAPCSESRVYLGWGWPAQPVLIILSAGLLENVEKENAAARQISLREQCFSSQKSRLRWTRRVAHVYESQPDC